MQVGTVFMSFMGGPPGYRREFGQWIKEAEVLLDGLSQAGFTFVAFTHSYQSAGSGGIQPLVLVSRLAPISGDLRLATQVVLLPLMNGMDAAYNAVTLDHITEGRLDLGIGLGYHPLELEAFGISRADRVPKFEESVRLMKEFWKGEPVHFRGRYHNVSGTCLTLRPVQEPHPPLWGSAQSHGAAARAGRILDGIVIGPQTTFEDVGGLLDTFRSTWAENWAEAPERVGAWRVFLWGDSPEDGYRRSVEGGRLTFKRYHEGGMQEATTVNLPLELREDTYDRWTISGSYQDCLAGLRRCRDELGLTHVTCQFYNLPDSFEERMEWLDGFGSEVISKL